jgi:hypothetical protein
MRCVVPNVTSKMRPGQGVPTSRSFMSGHYSCHGYEECSL